MVEHGMGVVGSEVAGLGAEVEEDGIRLPVAKSTDGSLVDTQMRRAVALPERRL